MPHRPQNVVYKEKENIEAHRTTPTGLECTAGCTFKKRKRKRRLTGKIVE